MCGRHRLSRRKQLVEKYFENAPWDDDWNPLLDREEQRGEIARKAVSGTIGERAEGLE
jgi:hypothetical protein